MSNKHLSQRRLTPILVCLVSAAAIAANGAAASAKPAVPAAAAVPAKVTLNQQAIHIAYNEGDFDKVTREIETFTQANKTYARADSVFIAKHLAVVYTANPNTREKGKYYMYRLLEMMPSAELVDMFVSDEIDRIFERVRKEFIARQSSFGVDTAKIALPQKPSGRAPETAAQPAPAPSATASAPSPTTGHSSEYESAGNGNPLWKRPAFWIASGAGVAVAGAIITFVSLQDDGGTGGKTYKIPAESTP